MIKEGKFWYWKHGEIINLSKALAQHRFSEQNGSRPSYGAAPRCKQQLRQPVVFRAARAGRPRAQRGGGESSIQTRRPGPPPPPARGSPLHLSAPRRAAAELPATIRHPDAGSNSRYSAGPQGKLWARSTGTPRFRGSLLLEPREACGGLALPRGRGWKAGGCPGRSPAAGSGPLFGAGKRSALRAPGSERCRLPAGPS